MKRMFLWLFVLFAALPAQAQQPAAWLTVDIGVIGASSEEVLHHAMDEVRDHGYSGLIIRIDTPGGALENTRNMVKLILAAPYPVVAWVGPGGSRAGSAGSFITLAAHIAAMAPGTNIGAAHPVDAIGKDLPDDQDEMARKVENDTMAFMESIANARGRNADMARSFVATSVSITDKEALENNVIDVIAPDINALLKAIDGKTVKLDNGQAVVIATTGASQATYEHTLREKLLEILANPNLFYLLFLVGIIGLGYELTHPGVMVPGVVGAISLICALIATSVLPVSAGAAALIVVGAVMMTAEMFVPSFGALGIGGFVAFVLGSVFLVDPKNEAGLRVSWFAIAPGALTVAGAALFLGWIVMRARSAPVMSGQNAMVGVHGIALDDFTAARGQVRVAGAIWTASAPPGDGDSIRKGDSIIVSAVEGLALHVTKKL